ncbi:uncharacterized protein [Leptinotarsa decemlineata]|uniref:uncharacterized protein n=1 Tax=Leptinotarsa decemlineata TaxID=7539 RepID=UPI003D30403F
MNSLAVAILFVAVAYTSASGIGLGYGGHSARGALEGALGGQWIPDVPVAAHGAAIVGAPALGLGFGPAGLGLAGAGLGWGVGGLGWGAGIAGHGSARGALEGALGGQWIPDTHGK